MLDHIGIDVRDFDRAMAFYDRALAPLGWKRLMTMRPGEYPGTRCFAGYGRERPQFWIGDGGKGEGRLHVAFAADDHALVDAFYRAALEAGGKDNGPPGPRPHYHASYYGAFVLDLDGHNIEAVCHR